MSAALADSAGVRWRPRASVERIRARARLYALIRDFFAAREVLEVTTPALVRHASLDPEIEALRITGGVDDRWLRTSPEPAHKRLLAHGVGDLYELGPCFRRDEAGRRHSPEFTLLEWYRVGFSRGRLIDEVCELIQRCAQRWGRTLVRQDITFRAAVMQATGLDPFAVDDPAAASLAREHGAPAGLSRDQALDFLLATAVAADWPADGLTVVTDYPADRPAMAEVRAGVADRFEVFAGPLELANGYQELTDADELDRRWAGQDAAARDDALTAAMRCGLPRCAGVALGVDRLLMVLEGCNDIADVQAIPS